jgi:hydrogenase maturation protein HypF
VYRLAVRCGLAGFVRNEVGGVWIEVEGDPEALAAFEAELRSAPPPRAHIEALRRIELVARAERGFRIEVSGAERGTGVQVAPDVATCARCLAEIGDPRERRHRYAFTNCTDCGPRLTIVRAAPYDRANTTMAGFDMCADCRAEYEDPEDRRFHAEPIACPTCGPHVWLSTAAAERIDVPDPIARAGELLRAGRILAVKGIGGYHLACDAAVEDVVAELRRRKGRDERPFAILVPDLVAAERVARIGAVERALLESPEHPIVLVPRRPDAAVAFAVAGDGPRLGVLLPYAPLHHLLARAFGPRPLVFTSGNRSDEPIQHRDDVARHLLGPIADVFLVHDRPIHLRCDDSVVAVVDDVPLPLRRARGFAPSPLRLPRPCATEILALGAHLKTTFALGRGDHAIVSHHLGDLDELSTVEAYAAAIAHYEQLFDVRPKLLVHDLHPDAGSTRYALERARRESLPTMAVQHHEAHVASCLVDAGEEGPVIGVAFDGLGLGTDGTIWGGEFFTGGLDGLTRVAHLATVPQPGGDLAVQEPWRMAIAHAVAAGAPLDTIKSAVDARAFATVLQQVERGTLAPPASSMGRLFDAVAALTGVRYEVHHEAQAAMELQWAAERASPADGGAYPFDVREEGGLIVVDSAPLIRAVVSDRAGGVTVPAMARRFHDTAVEMVVSVARTLRGRTSIDVVALSGGVFANALLLSGCTNALRAEGFRVLRHRRLPPNDGGLCVGQLVLAAARRTL